jgi:hypothetical protein
MKIKTSELTGAALDWAVAACEGYAGIALQERTNTDWYSPSTNWAQGGPIIDREEIGIKRNAPCSDGRKWEASGSITAKGAGYRFAYGPTPLIAAMRCYVVSKLGDTVDIPEELK